MANTSLTCPHCGSSLSFGTEIRVGTAVECLICMQSFAAQPNELPVDLPTAIVASPSPPPMGIAVAAKAKPAGVPTANKAPTATPRAEPAGATGKFVLLALGMLGVLIIGVGVAVMWLSHSQAPGETTPDKQFATNGAAVPSPDGFSTDPVKVKPANPLSSDPFEDRDDDLRRKLEAEKVLLARKNPIKPIGGDLAFDPISTIPTASLNAAGLDQEKINQAIAKGVVYLKRTQHPNGTWHSGHEVGYAAIGGLTLLEAGVPPDDPAVQKAAAFVRANAAYHKKTYEISLTVLFLDRLRDARDRAMIQWLALRILAGQNDSGGWSYDCPVPPPLHMHKLYTFLQSHRPALQNPIYESGKAPLTDPLAPASTQANDPLQQFNNMILAQGNGTNDAMLPAKKGVAVAPPAKGKAKTPAPISPKLLMPDLRSLPVVQNQGKKKGQQIIRNGAGDNSNTQFALLALWTARRHNIPTDAALVFAYQRFQVSQSPDGGWGYHHNIGNSTQTMTCVGLLGEAMGHGAAPDVIGFNPMNPKEPIIRPVLEDPAIQRGLAKLAGHIGEPTKDSGRTRIPMQNLYFLWSVERVAMLYDLKTINGKDWYGWGAQVLVYNQQPDGAWVHGQFHGESPPINTCLALLFLKRSNLVQDLTNQIRLHSAIRDPG